MVTLQKLSVHSDESMSRAYFFFVGEFNVDDITSIMKLHPTYAFNKGDERKGLLKKDGSPSFYEFSKWSYGTEYEATRDIPAQCERVVHQLTDKTNEINSISQKYNCEVRFEIVSVIEKGKAPALIIDQKIMSFCTDVNADIDIDIYVNPYDESENSMEVNL